MGLSFIGMTGSSTGSQVRTAGLWNIAVALDRLREHLEFATKESHRASSLLTSELLETRDYLFTLRSGATVGGKPITISTDWIVVQTSTSDRALLAVSSVESIIPQTHRDPS